MMDSLPPVANVVEINNGGYRINIELLRTIFSQPDVKENPIAIYSLTGPSRSGKSYLLNVFMHQFDISGSSADMQVAENQVKIPRLFETSCSLNTTTIGIKINTRPKFVSRVNKVVAVFLLDTQGSSSFEHSIDEDSVIHAISNILSSVQIVNCKNRIDSSVVNELGTFSLKSKTYKTSGAQDLLLLVRDWERPGLHDFGINGGRQYIDKLRAEHNNSAMIEFTKRFEKFSCFLMPHPGKKVATTDTDNYDDINIDMRKANSELFRFLFSSDNLVVKKMDGREVTGEAMIQELNKISLELGRQELGVKSMFEENLTKLMRGKIARSIEVYRATIEETVEQVKTEDVFNRRHNIACEAALEVFTRGTSNRTQEKFQSELDEKIYTEYQSYLVKPLIIQYQEEWKENIKQLKHLFVNLRRKFADDGVCYLRKTKGKVGANEFRHAKYELAQLLGEAYKEEVKRRTFNKTMAVAIGGVMLLPKLYYTLANGSVLALDHWNVTIDPIKVSFVLAIASALAIAGAAYKWPATVEPPPDIIAHYEEIEDHVESADS